MKRATSCSTRDTKAFVVRQPDARRPAHARLRLPVPQGRRRRVVGDDHPRAGRVREVLLGHEGDRRSPSYRTVAEAVQRPPRGGRDGQLRLAALGLRLDDGGARDRRPSAPSPSSPRACPSASRGSWPRRAKQKGKWIIGPATVGGHQGRLRSRSATPPARWTTSTRPSSTGPGRSASSPSRGGLSNEAYNIISRNDRRPLRRHRHRRRRLPRLDAARPPPALRGEPGDQDARLPRRARRHRGSTRSSRR